MEGAYAITSTAQPLLIPSTYVQLDRYLNNLADATTQEKMMLANISLTTLTTNLANLTMAFTLLASSNAPPKSASSS